VKIMPSRSGASELAIRNGDSWISVPIACPAPCRQAPISGCASMIARCAASTSRQVEPTRVTATAAVYASWTTSQARFAQYSAARHARSG
jgi:hypothetical protein